MCSMSCFRPGRPGSRRRARSPPSSGPSCIHVYVCVVVIQSKYSCICMYMTLISSYATFTRSVCFVVSMFVYTCVDDINHI